jgi:hypothetical protein
MKELKIIVPNKVPEITIGMYQQYAKLIQGLGEEFAITEFMKLKMVSIFCKLPMDVVRYNLHTKDIEDIIKTITPLLISLAKNEYTFQSTAVVSEIEFGFIHNLDKMEAGEYSDADSYFGKPEFMHKMAAVLFRPITRTKNNKLLNIHQYDLEPYCGTDYYAEQMREFPAYLVISAEVFFWDCFNELRSHFLDYTSLEARKILEKMSKKDLNGLNHPGKISVPGGDGTKVFL